ncbi:MAG: XdhC/CoxI family protein, partial [Clostridium sp.]
MFTESYKVLIDKIKSGTSCVLITYLDFTTAKKGFISNKILITSEEINSDSIPLYSDIYDKILTAIETGKIQSYKADNKEIIIEPFMPNPRLIIFGGGHVAKPVSEFASRVGFEVTVIDDRPFFANTKRFPEAKNVICEDFEKSFNNICFRKSDFVVIITRGHKHDGIVLRKSLEHELTYIGMIGSKRRVRGMMEELTSEGYSPEKLSTINSPIGLDIGAVTPDEIGISIVSQLIKHKNTLSLDKKDKKFSLPELDIEVSNKIYEQSDIPKAILTILSSKGSVPRKAGAKMIAYLDGRTIGSIGGGCSE